MNYSPVPADADQYEIDPELRLVLLRGPPPQEFARWKATMDRILADPRYQRGFNFLSDRRTPGPPSTTEIAQAAADYLVSRVLTLSGARWAVVAGDMAQYGMARMAASLAREARVSIQAFYDYERALAWLRAPAIEEP